SSLKLKAYLPRVMKGYMIPIHFGRAGDPRLLWQNLRMLPIRIKFIITTEMVTSWAINGDTHCPWPEEMKNLYSEFPYPTSSIPGSSCFRTIEIYRLDSMVQSRLQKKYVFPQVSITSIPEGIGSMRIGTTKV